MLTSEPRSPRVRLHQVLTAKSMKEPKTAADIQLCCGTSALHPHQGLVSLFSFEELQSNGQRDLTTPTGYTFGRVISQQIISSKGSRPNIHYL